MRTELVLARHGESAWHQEDRYAGSSDIALSPEGHRQARLLANWSSNHGVDAIITSPLQRCRDTARPSEDATGITAAVDDRLREVDFGQAEGMTRGELRHSFAAEFAAFERNPVDHPLPGGESPRDAIRRLRDGMDEITARHVGQRVLVIGHSTAFRLLLCDLLEIPLKHYRSTFPRLVNCAVTRLHVVDRGAALLTLNEEPR